MTRLVRASTFFIGQGGPLAVIAGPCVLEDYGLVKEVAQELDRVTGELGLPILFKASYDKANRSSLTSYRGPGLEPGLKLLADLKSETRIPVLSDVHEVAQVERAAEVLDIIQIPAFLCRQTDLLVAAARAGKPVNIKKGQFLAPWDIQQAIAKVTQSGNEDVLITERGTCFGYNTLVVDMRALPRLRALGYPVIFDATHAVQMPGAAGTASGGEREFVAVLARAAVAAGVDGVFLEVHPNPDAAPCDGPNMVPLAEVGGLLKTLSALHQLVRSET